MISSEGKLSQIKIICLIALLFIPFSRIDAQAPEKYKAVFNVKNQNGKEVLNLFAESKFDDSIEGYFIITSDRKLLMGSINKLDFLRDNIFGGEINFLISKWVKNEFPIHDLETFSNGVDVSSAIAFNIKPYIKNEKTGTIGYTAKFAVYSRNNSQNNGNTEFELKLYYKLIFANWDEVTEFDFLQPYIKDHTFSIKLNRFKGEDSILSVKESIYDVIKKSINESNIKNSGFNFTLMHLVLPNNEKSGPFDFYNKYLYLSNQAGVERKAILANKYSLLDTIKLNSPIYCIKYPIPFTLQNEEKVKSYKKYETYSAVMQSDYSIILIPISYERGYLTLDIIVNFTKLHLNDNIERWSPFKKRIELQIADGTLDIDGLDSKGKYIELPEENWSVNTTVGKDKYDIYGHSDYDKFIKEELYIKLDGISKEE